MPITDELKSINRLEQAGFTHDQAKAVVEVVKERARQRTRRWVGLRDSGQGLLETRKQIGVQLHLAELYRQQQDRVFLKMLAVIAAVPVIGGVYRFL